LKSHEFPLSGKADGAFSNADRSSVRGFTRSSTALCGGRCSTQAMRIFGDFFEVKIMRTLETKRAYKSFNAPVYEFDTDSTLERVLRDPMAVLLGRSSLSLQGEASGTDPYNRTGRLANRARR
jgi:hypothetical protein